MPSPPIYIFIFRLVYALSSSLIRGGTRGWRGGQVEWETLVHCDWDQCASFSMNLWEDVPGQRASISDYERSKQETPETHIRKAQTTPAAQENAATQFCCEAARKKWTRYVREYSRIFIFGWTHSTRTKQSNINQNVQEKEFVLCLNQQKLFLILVRVDTGCIGLIKSTKAHCSNFWGECMRSSVPEEASMTVILLLQEYPRPLTCLTHKEVSCRGTTIADCGLNICRHRLMCQTYACTYMFKSL